MEHAVAEAGSGELEVGEAGAPSGVGAVVEGDLAGVAIAVVGIGGCVGPKWRSR